MARFATGVTLFTTLDDEGQVHAMTANALTSVCLEPPLVLVCVAHSTNSYRFVENRGRFGTNILRDNQEAIGIYYAQSVAGSDETVENPFFIRQSGYPALRGALAFFGCKVVVSYVHGDHTIYVAEVEDMTVDDTGNPLLFFNSQFRFLEDAG